MTKGFLTIAAVLALVLLFAAAAVPETEPITAPALVSSAWHESQTYVCTIGGHKFFEGA